MTILADVRRWLTSGFTLRDESAVRYASGSDDNLSGVPVTPETAMRLSTVWRCVHLLAETIATLPLSVYKVDRQGNSSVATGDSVHSLVHDQPNMETSPVEFWQSMVLSMLLWGNGYAAKVRTGPIISSLVTLLPQFMSIRRMPDGTLQYRYSTAGGLQTFASEDIFHVKLLSMDGVIGLSPIAYARNSMGSAIALDASAAKQFRNGIRVPGFLGTDKIMTADQRMVFEENIGKKFNAQLSNGAVPLMEAGFKWNAISMNPEDAQMLESRGFAVEDICRWFGVPPFMVGHTEKSTSWGSGLEQQNIGFLTYVLRPYLKRIEQAVERQLIADNLRATRFAKFNIEALLRADSAARAAFYASAAQNGWMSRDEIRDKEDLPALGTEGSKALTVQSNLLPIDLLGKVAPSGTPVSQDEPSKEPAK